MESAPPSPLSQRHGIPLGGLAISQGVSTLSLSMLTGGLLPCKALVMGRRHVCLDQSLTPAQATLPTDTMASPSAVSSPRGWGGRGYHYSRIMANSSASWRTRPKMLS